MLLFTIALVLPAVALASAPSGPWDAFNYAPDSRTVWPSAIRRVEGDVQNPDQLVKNAGSATLASNGSWVTLDYGKEVCIV